MYKPHITLKILAICENAQSKLSVTDLYKQIYTDNQNIYTIRNRRQRIITSCKVLEQSGLISITTEETKHKTKKYLFETI